MDTDESDSPDLVAWDL